MRQRSVRRTSLALAAACTAFLVGGCMDGGTDRPPIVAGGDAAEGRDLIRAYTCGGCHVIPGVSAATGMVGPPLTDWVERQYIAGSLWNTPDNLVRWLMDPESIEPGTNMPNMDISEAQARHMAAYLYTLGDTDRLGPPHPFPVEWLESLRMGSHGGTPEAPPIPID